MNGTMSTGGVWNGLIDKKPALIARCAGKTDVVATVNFARAYDLLFAVRAGGHNVAGNAVCEDGLVIDLSGMRDVQVDPKHRTFKLRAGPRWAISTARRRPSAWPCRPVWSPPPVSRA